MSDLSKLMEQSLSELCAHKHPVVRIQGERLQRFIAQRLANLVPEIGIVPMYRLTLRTPKMTISEGAIRTNETWDLDHWYGACLQDVSEHRKLFVRRDGVLFTYYLAASGIWSCDASPAHWRLYPVRIIFRILKDARKAIEAARHELLEMDVSGDTAELAVQMLIRNVDAFAIRA